MFAKSSGVVVALALAATALAACGSSHPVAGKSSSGSVSSQSPTTSTAGHGEPANLAPVRSLPLGAGGCPAAWGAEPLLPCNDIPSAFTPDPSLGTTSGLSASGRARRFAQHIGCTQAVLETLIVGSSTDKANSQGANLASAAVGCPSSAAALRGLEDFVAAAKDGNAVLDPHAPRVGQDSAAFFSATSHHDTGYGVVVSGSTVLYVEVSASTALPIDVVHELTLPNAVVGFARDQYHKLLQVGPVRLPLPAPDLAAPGALSAGVGGCPQAWLSAPLLPCKDIPHAFSPDPSAGDSASASRNAQALQTASKYGCTGAASETFVIGASTAQAASQGAILVSEEFSCPSAADADSAMQGTFASLGVPADPGAPRIGDRSELGTSTASGQANAGVAVVSGTSVAIIGIRAASALPSRTLQVLVSPSATAGFARDQLAQLRKAGAATS